MGDVSSAPHGRYHSRGWTVQISADADSDESRAASLHEAMHDRLQLTTLYGCTAALLLEVSGLNPRAVSPGQADAFLRESVNVHEEFATWMSAVALGWGGDRLPAAFPRYARHFRRAQARLGDFASPYAAMHAAQAVARVCMQPGQLAAALDGGLVNVTPSRTSAAMRPDYRARVLTRLLSTEGWGLLAAMPDRPDMDLQSFAEDNDDEWLHWNQTAYDWCATLLRGQGIPTLPYDGHLPYIEDLVTQAKELTGQRSRFTVDAASGTSLLDSALLSVETETLHLGPPLPVIVRPAGTPPAELLAGDQDRAHLFLAIRPTIRIASQYQWPDTSPFDGSGCIAVLRCQGPNAIELLDVSDVGPASLDGLPTVVSISMKALSDEAIVERWRPLLGRHQSTVLVDLRLSHHLPLWLADPSAHLHYTTFQGETPVGWTFIVLFTITTPDGESRLHLVPVTRLLASGFELWLHENPAFQGRIHHAPELAHQPLIRFTLAHLLMEERSFDMLAGDTHEPD